MSVVVSSNRGRPSTEKIRHWLDIAPALTSKADQIKVSGLQLLLVAEDEIGEHFGVKKELAQKWIEEFSLDIFVPNETRREMVPAVAFVDKFIAYYSGSELIDRLSSQSSVSEHQRSLRILNETLEALAPIDRVQYLDHLKLISTLAHESARTEEVDP